MVLLEVLAALAILVFAAAVVMGTLHASLRAATDLKRDAVASDLAVTVLSQLQLGQLPAVAQENRPFDPPHEDWTWTLEDAAADAGPTITAADGSSASRSVELIIRHTPTGHTLRLMARIAPTPPPAPPAPPELEAAP
jgi:type II secretory pathway pseudopilin PulG